MLSSLTLDYVKDWELVLGEFNRVLSNGGCMVFSMEHPYAKYDDHRQTSNYFEIELVEYEWSGFGMAVRVPSYRRPLSAVINPLLMAGFHLDQILEPTTTEEFRQKAPKHYQVLSRSPGFMCLRAVKR